MIRRLFVGLVLGLIIGGLVAAGLIAGLHVSTFYGGGGAVLAYLTAALTGTLTGLFAGKPIWSPNGKVEAGLKAFFGALIGAGLMFALREWAGGFFVDLNSTVAAAGAGPVGELPAASLPVIAALLGAFFELDNTGDAAEKGEKKEKAPSSARKRIAAGANGKARSRVADEEELDAGDDTSADPPHAKNQ